MAGSLSIGRSHTSSWPAGLSISGCYGHHQREGPPRRLLDCQIPGSCRQLPFPSVTTCEDVAAVVGPHSSPGVFCSLGPGSDASSAMVDEVSMVSGFGWSFSAGSLVSWLHWFGSLVTPGGEVGVQSPSLSPSVHQQGLTAVGMWSWEVKDLYIDVLEMKAIQLAFLNRMFVEPVILMNDEATVVAYFQKQGATVSRVMCDMAREVVRWSELPLLVITARYFPGKKSVLTDQLSCPDQVLPAEWSLLPWLSSEVCEIFGWPHVDLVTTRVNAKLLIHISPVLHHMTWKQYAFQHPWDGVTTYAFPPFTIERKGK